MLTLHLPKYIMFDEATSTFPVLPEVDAHFEHSLFSISKWEAKWHQAFLGNKEKTDAMVADYLSEMLLDDSIPNLLERLTAKDIDTLYSYISDPQTASVINTPPSPEGSSRHSVVTAEVVYTMMIARGIPMECQYWNFNRLITLIRVYDVRMNPGMKMDANWRMAENARRRKQYHTRG